MTRLKPHQWGGLITIGLVVVLTLAVLAPLWLPSAKKPLYYVIIPEGFTGPISLIYPVPNGVIDKPIGDEKHVRYYNLPAENAYLLVQNRPPEGAHIAFASQQDDGQIRPLVFYSSGYGGNDLYFAESRGLVSVLPPTALNDTPPLVEVRFAIYDRRDPSSLTAMNFDDGEGRRVSDQARQAAFEAIHVLQKDTP